MNLTPIKNNMTELDLQGIKVLFSYKTPVAYMDKKTGKFYKTSHKWSKTTSRHISQWLNGSSAIEVNQGILDDIREHMA